MRDIKAEFEKVKAEINALRAELNQINEEKRKWSGQQRALYKALSGHLQSIKDHKRERDSVTRLVKRLKQERDELNKLIVTKISEIKRLKDEKAALQKQYNIKGDPIKIKKEIAGIERRIETEAMPFEREKKLMKIMNSKKKELQNAQVIMEVVNKIRAVSREIDSLKAKAKEKHNLIQEKAAESQKHHEALIEAGKKLDEVQAEKKQPMEKILEFQKKLEDTEAKLEEELIKLKRISEEIRHQKLEKVAKKKEQIEKILKEKEMDVEEKIKKKKKLTTEDLLIFQRQES